MMGRVWKAATLMALAALPTAAVSDKGVSMAQFSEAKNQISDFSERLGAYAACYELVGFIRNAGYQTDTGGVIKTLFQGAADPAKVRTGFLEALEKDGFSFEQMMMLDRMLTEAEEKALAQTRAQLTSSDDKNMIRICSLARGQIKRQ